MRRRRGRAVDVERAAAAPVVRRARGDELRRRLEAVLHEQVQVVALVQHADRHLGVQLAEPARLAVLLRHELLVQRRDLDVEVVRREIEVGRERLRGPAVAIPLERERARLVLPRDGVEVEQLRELPLRVVREADGLVRKLLGVDGRAPYRTAVFDGCAATATSIASGANSVQLRREVVDDRTERDDVQHALTAAQQVDDLVVGLREHGASRRR